MKLSYTTQIIIHRTIQMVSRVTALLKFQRYEIEVLVQVNNNNSPADGALQLLYQQQQTW